MKNFSLCVAATLRKLYLLLNNTVTLTIMDVPLVSLFNCEEHFFITATWICSSHSLSFSFCLQALVHEHSNGANAIYIIFERDKNVHNEPTVRNAQYKMRIHFLLMLLTVFDYAYLETDASHTTKYFVILCQFPDKSRIVNDELGF